MLSKPVADDDKPDVQHIEKQIPYRGNEEAGDTRSGVAMDQLPPGYFRSSFFLGSMAAIGLGLFGGTAGFSFAAPMLQTINADIGPVSLCSESRAHSFCA